MLYYWKVSQNKAYMLLVYSKSKMENLEPEQIAVLNKLAKELERHG